MELLKTNYFLDKDNTQLLTSLVNGRTLLNTPLWSEHRYSYLHGYEVRLIVKEIEQQLSQYKIAATISTQPQDEVNSQSILEETSCMLNLVIQDKMDLFAYIT